MAEMKSSTLKPVQEILRSGVVPENYIQPKDEYEVGDGFVPLMDDLTIDFSLLSSSSPEELTKLRSALSSWGCAQLVNHGMPSTLLDEVQEMGKKFFTLPLKEKEKYSSKGNSLEGYGNDNTIREGSFNWNDKLHLQVYPFCKLGYWPGKPENFRITLQEYSIKTMILLETILKAMARSLNIEEKSFFELWGNDEEDMLHARFNFYPRCPSSDQVIGLKPHGDGTVITILLQDKEVEGLRILKDNRWFRVPIIPEAIVIHVGDLIERIFAIT
ncbi:hypothetical protein BVRB_7g158880 [Beta vulgaris subsp. vulgaris]|nr:hypothetical protein BVRB_7g158880 [Beta vulgaris subsp. vulgaris]